MWIPADPTWALVSPGTTYVAAGWSLLSVTKNVAGEDERFSPRRSRAHVAPQKAAGHEHDQTYRRDRLR
jgi:hypothetical protein